MFKGWEQQTWESLLIVTKTNYLPPFFFNFLRAKDFIAVLFSVWTKVSRNLIVIIKGLVV